LTPTSTNLELVCYILTQDFGEFAAVREDLLLRIMDFVEDSGTALAFPSQAVFLNPESASDKNKITAAMKQIAEQNQGATRNSGKND